MKILIVNNKFCEFGGAEKIAIQDYEWLKAQGHEVCFFATDSKPYYIENYEYSKYFPKYWRSTSDYIKNPFKYYYNFEAKNKFQQIINDIKPDIIHLHAIEDFTYSILSCCKNIPTIHTIHGNFVAICPGDLLYKNKSFCEKFYCKNSNYINCLINKCAKNKIEASIRRTLYAYISRCNFKNVDKFIFPSNALRKIALLSNLGINDDNSNVLHNYVTNYKNACCNNNLKEKYFLYVGRLGHEKGLQYLLKAMANLPKDIILHIVGSGPLELELKSFVNSNNLCNIKFLGYLTGKDLLFEYQDCIATITPSNCFDNFPTTNLESFINGKPVIASNIGGIPEQIEHNKTGLLFEPANIKQLEENILTYWNNPELVIEHGKNGYQKAITQYTEEKYYNELIKIYIDLLK